MVWQKALQISDEIIENWKQNMQSGEDLLFWALSHNQMDADAYFAWAKQEYELPYVKNDYFSQANVDEVWQEYKSFPLFSSKLFPIGKWDNSVFIACIEPPEDLSRFQSLGSFQFVLCHPQPMMQLWSRWHQELNHEPTLPELPSDQDDAFYSQPDASLPSFSMQEIPALEDQTQTETKVFHIDEIKPKMQENADISFDNLDFSQVTQTEPAKPQVQELRKEQPAKMPEPIEPKAQNDLPDLSFTNFNANEATANLAPPPPPVAPHKPKMPPPPPISPKKPVPKPRPLHQEQVPKLDFAKEGEKDIHSYAKKVMQAMTEDFSQRIFLQVENEKATPIHWEGFISSGSENFSINLNPNSIFKIAARSKQAYHGYVVGNETNDHFFQHFNQGKTPRHVSIFPLIKNKRVYALIMGTALNGDRISLAKYQGIADMCAEVFPEKEVEKAA